MSDQLLCVVNQAGARGPILIWHTHQPLLFLVFLNKEKLQKIKLPKFG